MVEADGPGVAVVANTSLDGGQKAAALDWVEATLLEQLGGLVERNVALSAFTTFRIGGPARLLFRPQCVEDLETLAEVMAQAFQQWGWEIPVVVIGQGSNLLIDDQGFFGIAVQLSGDFINLSIEDPGLDQSRVVHAGAAVKLPVLARKCAAAGCGGLGWMVGVPGSVGGAVRMNAGGHGSDVSVNLKSVTVVDLYAPTGQRVRSIAPSQLDLHYRSSTVKRHQVVVNASFEVVPADSALLEEELSEIVRWRRVNQPGGANCGSVFTNPPGHSAGKLIDELGLKGFRLSPTATASVSEKHANFIQADPNGQSGDVWALIIHVRAMVFERFGIDLHPEVQTLGFEAELPPLGSSV